MVHGERAGAAIAALAAVGLVATLPCCTLAFSTSLLPSSSSSSSSSTLRPLCPSTTPSSTSRRVAHTCRHQPTRARGRWGAVLKGSGADTVGGGEWIDAEGEEEERNALFDDEEDWDDDDDDDYDYDDDEDDDEPREKKVYHMHHYDEKTIDALHGAYRIMAKMRGDNLMTGDTSAENDVLRANLDFYITRCNKDQKKISQVWKAQDNDVTCIYPLTAPVTGSESVVNVYLKMFRNDDERYRRCKVAPLDATVRVVGSIGVVTCVEELRVPGMSTWQRTSATNVFRKYGDDWKLIHHQATQHPERGIPTGKSAPPPGKTWNDYKQEPLSAADLQGGQSEGLSALSDLLGGQQGGGGDEQERRIIALGADGQPLDPQALEDLLSSLDKGGLGGGLKFSTSINTNGMDNPDEAKRLSREFGEALRNHILGRMGIRKPSPLPGSAGGGSIDKSGADKEWAAIADSLNRRELRKRDTRRKANKLRRAGAGGAGSNGKDGSSRNKNSKSSSSSRNGGGGRDNVRKAVAALQRIHKEGRITAGQKKTLLTDIIKRSSGDEASMVEMAYDLLLAPAEYLKEKRVKPAIDEAVLEEFAEQCVVFAKQVSTSSA